jgi:hypothetical protein
MRGYAFISSNFPDRSSAQPLFILVRSKSFETKSVFFGGMLRLRNIGRAEPDLRGLQKQADIARCGCTFLDLSNLEFQGF